MFSAAPFFIDQVYNYHIIIFYAISFTCLAIKEDDQARCAFCEKGKQTANFQSINLFLIFNCILMTQCSNMKYSGAGPGFLENGVHIYKGLGVRFADFISFLLNFP